VFTFTVSTGKLVIHQHFTAAKYQRNSVRAKCKQQVEEEPEMSGGISRSRQYCLVGWGLAAAVGTVASPCFAEDGRGVDSGDTAFMLVSAALVMLMTPGLALFYGGMVRRKNVLGTIMQSFVAVGLLSLQWILWGYSLAFAPGGGFLFGGLQWVGLRGVDAGVGPYAKTIPHLLFMVYQGMFAVITPALISGAFAERKKFSTYLVFLLLWATFVYDPICHWVWGGGWLGKLGTLDFAGGTVVHISSGVSALVAALVVGRRRHLEGEPPLPHNMTMTLLGAALLWFGWFGFNAGSALSAGSLAAVAFVTTNTAAAAAALSWMFAEWKLRGKPTALGFASGAVAGLVGVTPAAGFVSPMGALFIGVTVALACLFFVARKERLGYDDSLDAFGVHGIGGTWGALATGLLATRSVNEAGSNGLLYGNPSQLGVQCLGVIVTWVYAAVVTFLLLKALDKLMGLRVSEDEEEEGLDITVHGESGYLI